MEGSETKRPVADRKTVANLDQIVKMLSEGRSFNLRLNGRKVRFTERARLEIGLESDPRSGVWEIDIRWDDRRAEPAPRRIGARVIAPVAASN